MVTLTVTDVPGSQSHLSAGLNPLAGTAGEAPTGQRSESDGRNGYSGRWEGEASRVPQWEANILPNPPSAFSTGFVFRRVPRLEQVLSCWSGAIYFKPSIYFE